MPIDATQLARLIDEHAVSLRLWAAGRCGWPDDAVQDAFCRLARVDPLPDNPVAWLYRVVRNCAEKQRLAESRRRHREQAYSRSEAIENNPSSSLEAKEVVRALEQIAPEYREVVIARIWGQMSLAETAELCGISTATAFRRLNDALEQLRSQLEPTCPKNPT